MLLTLKAPNDSDMLSSGASPWAIAWRYRLGRPKVDNKLRSSEGTRPSTLVVLKRVSLLSLSDFR